MAALRGVKIALITVLATISFSLQAQLTANFTATPVSGCAPQLVSFSDQSAGNPTAWKWDLGNGTISYLQDPSVTYFNPGQYNVKLVVYNAAGDSSVIIKSQFISIYAQPTVAFTGTPLTGCFPLPVSFTDQSTPGNGTITQWQWDLGDGTITTQQHPSHVYTAAGNYNVTLRVTNSFGCNKVLTKTQYVKISDGVTADFSANATTSCQAPFTVTFQDLSTGTGTLAYQWAFGDGGTATSANPSHTYNTTGTYNVRLIVTNTSGCTDTIIKSSYISVGAYNAAFTAPAAACINTPVTFTNTSNPAPSSVAWAFGDGNTAATLNPANIYTLPGVYTVRLIADFGGCLDTALASITVFNKPTAAFTAPVTTACKPPLTVNFANTSVGATSYVWQFGDGNTTTVSNPVHTYTTPGLFTVTLIATNANGCSDTLVMPDFIKIQAPHAVINNLPVANCAPLTLTFSSTVTSVDPIVSYQWDFGNGNTSTLPNPTQTFAAGQYDIQLIITTAGGCTDTAFVPRGVTASVKPAANFSANPRNVCAFQDINFTDLTTGTVTNWQWLFGDGGTSSQQNPIYQYQDTGYFDVTLIACNAGCCDTVRFVNYIHISPPIANFAAPLDCNSRMTKQFTDQSIGADEWHWNFGDGNTSTIQNPTHTYLSTGNYTVTLTVKNNATGCEHTKTMPLQIVNEKANFTESASTVCKYTPVSFNAIGNTVANVASFVWDFGDGNTATGQNQTHSYLQSGQFTVRLIVTDILGCPDTLTKNLIIQVNGPVAAFTPGPSGTCMLTAITFSDNSTDDGTHPINTWIWNYGDGIIDTLSSAPFVHAYTTQGNYQVSLKVIDVNGCYDSATASSPIIISQPLSDFSSVDTLSCPTKDIHFINTSTGPGLTYQWNFGDGNTSALQNPVHTYAADGLYTITLIINDQYGCTDTLIKPDYIRIVSPHSIYAVSDTLSTCPPLLVTFTNNSQNTISELWDFGDGTSTISANPTHFYTSAGVFVTKLTVTGPGGCVDVSQKTIIVRGPQGSFTYNPINGCKPLTVNFNAATKDRISFIWDYNDGSTNVTADSVVTHTYTIPGVYLPKMILVDTNGCVVPITGPDTILVSGVSTKFGFINHTYCDDAFITFADSTISNDVIVSYAWDFGDGNTSTQQNPTHHYTATGIYYPKLTVTSQRGCVDSSQLPAPVKIVSSPQAAVTNTPNGCTELNVSFAGSLAVPDTSAVSWYWNFGNGNTSALQNPPLQLYTTAGNYPVQLIVTNSSGCKDTVNTLVQAFAIPKINAGIDTLVCRGRAIALSASGASNYVWSPTNGLSCNNCPSPLASPDSVTKYIVRGITPQGCSSTDTVIVSVQQRFAMNKSAGDTMCTGGSARLFASGAYSYTWSPSDGLSSTVTATPLASPKNTTTYRVIGKDDKNCFADTAYVLVKVYPIPTVDAGDDKTINVGQRIELKPTVSNDVTKVLWTPLQNIINVNGNNITVKPVQTTTYTAEVRNEGGCKARDNVTIYVLCDGANIFIPNTFTPNGDGVNDIFYPRGTGLFKIKTLRVFSRWGEVMYEKNNFMPNDASAGWDGTFKGKVLTPDVYVYTVDVICDNSTILTLKGNVALLQ